MYFNSLDLDTAAPPPQAGCSSISSTVGNGGLRNTSLRTYAEVPDIFREIGLTPYEVTAAYFDGFHTWLPIFDPLIFAEGSSVREGSDCDEHALAILTMSLIAIPESKLVRVLPNLGLQKRYVQAKMLFTQTQLLVPRSMLLIQAGLVICAFEYVSRNIDAAYGTVSACLSMARLMWLDRVQQGSGENDSGKHSTVHNKQHRDVWSCLVALYKYVGEQRIITREKSC